MALKTISLVDPVLVDKNIKNYPNLLKHFGWISDKARRKDAEEFPLAVVLSRKTFSSRGFLKEIDNTIGKVEKIKFFNSVVKRSKNKQEFWDAYSEIAVARHCLSKGIDAEFLPQTRGIGDLKANIDNEEVFFEVKRLVNSKIIERLENSIKKIVSPYTVGFFISPFISTIEANAFLNEVKIALGSKYVTKRKLPYGRFTTYLKKKSSVQGTLLMPSQIGLIPFEPTKFKLSLLMGDSRKKFQKENVNLLVLDIQRWTIPIDYVEKALQGEKKGGGLYKTGNETITATVILSSIGKTRPHIIDNPNALRKEFVKKIIQELF